MKLENLVETYTTHNKTEREKRNMQTSITGFIYLPNRYDLRVCVFFHTLTHINLF